MCVFRNVPALLLLALSASILLRGEFATADDEFIIGATAHLVKGRFTSVSENLRVFKEAGLRSMRADVGWGSWEKSRGVYVVPNDIYVEYMDKAQKMGVEPLQILDYANSLYDGGNYPKSPEAIEGFVRFCEHVVSTYRGKGHLYQLWNEWDGGCGMEAFRGQGDAKSYVRLAAATYPRIKAIDPSITIIANSVCTGEKFLEETLKEGVLKSCDGVAFHAYLYQNIGEKRLPEAYAERVSRIDKLVKSYNGGKDFPIYLTETGWPNHVTCGGSTDAETGDYIARTFLLIKSIPSVRGLWWYNFENGGLDPEFSESNFGISQPDLTPKEPYYVIRSIAEIVSKGKFVERVESPEKALVVLKFKMPDGQDVLAAWSPVEDCGVQVTLKNAQGAKGPLTTFLAGFAKNERSWGAREWVGFKNQMTKRDAPFMPCRFQFTVKGRPFIVMGDLAGVELEKVQRISVPDVKKPQYRYMVFPERIVPCLPSSAPDRPVKFGGPMDYLSAGALRAGTQDLDAAFSLTWDKDALNLMVEVSDDKMFQEGGDSEQSWNGDSVQIAFQNLAKDADHSRSSEYALALTARGAEVYREFSQINLPSGLAGDVKLDVKREGMKTVYMAKFPLKELGFKALAPEAPFGFSILVNDNDGSGRKGFLHWGNGIGSGGKIPSAYNWLVVKE